MNSISLLNTEEILSVVKCGVLVSMSLDDRQYFVNLKDDILIIQTAAGMTVDSLCNESGTLVRDEFIDYTFEVDYGFTIHGVPITNRKCIDQVLANLRVKECHAKATKRLALNEANTLQEKIKCKRQEDAKIRQIQNDYDNVSISFWHLVDIIERT